MVGVRGLKSEVVRGWVCEGGRRNTTNIRRNMGNLPATFRQVKTYKIRSLIMHMLLFSVRLLRLRALCRHFVQHCAADLYFCTPKSGTIDNAANCAPWVPLSWLQNFVVVPSSSYADTGRIPPPYRFLPHRYWIAIPRFVTTRYSPNYWAVTIQTINTERLCQ